MSVSCVSRLPPVSLNRHHQVVLVSGQNCQIRDCILESSSTSLRIATLWSFCWCVKGSPREYFVLGVDRQRLYTTMSWKSSTGSTVTLKSWQQSAMLKSSKAKPTAKPLLASLISSIVIIALLVLTFEKTAWQLALHVTGMLPAGAQELVYQCVPQLAPPPPPIEPKKFLGLF